MNYKNILVYFILLLLTVFGVWKYTSDDVSIDVIDIYTYVSEPDSYLSKSTGTQVTHIKVEDRKYDIKFDCNIYWNELENKSYKSVLESEVKRIDYETPARVYEEMLYVWQWWQMLKTIDLSSSWDIEDMIRKYTDSIFTHDCDIINNTWLAYFSWSDYMVYWYDLSDYSFDDIEKCPYLYQNNIPWFVYDRNSPDRLLMAVIQDGIGWRWDESWIGTLRW